MNNNNEKENIIVPTSLESAGKEVKKKSVLLLVSIIILVVSAVFLTYAWFTKMNSISSLQFDVARWDFRANHQTGEVFVNVYDYAELDNNTAAPGTEGYIPVKLSATASNTDVQFNLSVSSDVLTQPFKERLLFYYRNGDTLEQYRDGYEFDTVQGKYVPKDDYDSDKLVQFNGTTRLLAGVVKRGDTETEATIYWRWVYDAREALKEGIAIRPDYIDSDLWQFMLEKANDNSLSDDDFRVEAAKQGNENFLKYIEDWDKFDTQVGKYPDTFEKDMRASVVVQGVEIVTKVENDS